MFGKRGRSILSESLLTLIGIVIPLGALITIYKNFVSNAALETLIASITLSFFALYFFLKFISNKTKHKKSIKYPGLFDQLNNGFREVHWLQRKLKSETNEDIMIPVFERVCSCLADGFSDVTGTNCAACIKIITVSSEKENGYDEKDYIYETLCRNSNADNKRFKADIDTQKNGVEHTLSKNTAFNESLNSHDEFFFSNWLPYAWGYENSSFQHYGMPHRGRNPILRWIKWKLPYKSTIVVPIKPLPRSHKESELDDDCFGFLCLDSTSLKAFNKDYDPLILKGVADGIYNTFIKFSHINQ